jgi:hypothetical protein
MFTCLLSIADIQKHDWNALKHLTKSAGIHTHTLWYLTHWGPVTQICVFCVFALQLWKTDVANLCFNTRLVCTHLIAQYMDGFFTGPPGRMFKKNVTLLWIELMICDKYRGKNTGPQSVNTGQCVVSIPRVKHQIPKEQIWVTANVSAAFFIVVLVFYLAGNV